MSQQQSAGRASVHRDIPECKPASAKLVSSPHTAVSTMCAGRCEGQATRRIAREAIWTPSIAVEFYSRLSPAPLPLNNHLARGLTVGHRAEQRCHTSCKAGVSGRIHEVRAVAGNGRAFARCFEA
eukprot:356348-Chlamydomonas_euryale.AAC.15